MKTTTPVYSLLSLLGLVAALAWLSLTPMQVQAAEGDYRLGAGDLIRISVFDHEELAGDLRVSQSGNITFPLIGQVAVADLSTGEVEQMLSERLTSGGFIRRAQVSVLVIEYESRKVAVMGQVSKPGQYSLTASNRVLDVLALAGGLATEDAAEQATLLRKDGSKAVIDLRALFDGDISQNVEVGGGDIFNVPRAPQFYIYGEVNKPGVYRLERGMTVSRAISTGGGLTVRGTERRTIVKRRDETGEEKEYSARGTDVLQGDDVVLVRESWF